MSSSMRTMKENEYGRLAAVEQEAEDGQKEQMGEKTRQCTWKDTLPLIPSAFTECG